MSRCLYEAAHTTYGPNFCLILVEPFIITNNLLLGIPLKHEWQWLCSDWSSKMSTCDCIFLNFKLNFKTVCTRLLNGYLRLYNTDSSSRWAWYGLWSTCCSGPSFWSFPSTLSRWSAVLVWPSWWQVSLCISWESTGRPSHSVLILLLVRQHPGVLHKRCQDLEKCFRAWINFNQNNFPLSSILNCIQVKWLIYAKSSVQWSTRSWRRTPSPLGLKRTMERGLQTTEHVLKHR